MAIGARAYGTTQPAAPITGTQATLNGMATPNGTAAWAWFEWSVAPSACAPPPAGLVNWWPGGGNAKDLTGNNNGTNLNGKIIAYGQGKVGSAFNFDGVSTNVVQIGATNLPPPWTAVQLYANGVSQGFLSTT